MKFMLNHVLCVAALLAVAGSSATAADISVFSTGAPSAVLKILAVAFARDTGNQVEFTVGTPGDLQNKLAAGATPDPRRQLDCGQCAMPVPVLARMRTSLGSRWTRCANHTSGPNQSWSASHSTGRLLRLLPAARHISVRQGISSRF